MTDEQILALVKHLQLEAENRQEEARKHYDRDQVSGGDNYMSAAIVLLSLARAIRLSLNHSE